MYVYMYAMYAVCIDKYMYVYVCMYIYTHHLASSAVQ